MTYQPLARKYRPSKFSDLVGQENVSTALSNAIRLGREPHGVIFSGVRGIGKTTTARLYAKALNCEIGRVSEPCGSCESCIAIAKGIHEDVIEIDGASNNGVDEIRSLRETVAYAPQRGRFKVYIIDEVHMLSASAFNALLKTLEEPPAHVVFIMATTEMHKVPATILSRCLTFYLQKMTPKLIFERVAWILNQENIPYDERALWLVAREGQGSMRDALTFLDQAIALGDGKVTYEGLKNLVNGSSMGLFVELMDCVLRRDAKSVLKWITDLDGIGVQAKTFVGELANLSRHGLIIRTLGVDASEIQSLGFDLGELNRLQQVAASAKDFDLNRLFRTLVKCLSDLDGSSMDRFIAENYLLEWCFDPGLPSVEDLKKASFGSGMKDNKNLPKTEPRFDHKKDSYPTASIGHSPIQASNNPTPVQAGTTVSGQKTFNGNNESNLNSAYSKKNESLSTGEAKAVQTDSAVPSELTKTRVNSKSFSLSMREALKASATPETSLSSPSSTTQSRDPEVSSTHLNSKSSQASPELVSQRSNIEAAADFISSQEPNKKKLTFEPEGNTSQSQDHEIDLSAREPYDQALESVPQLPKRSKIDLATEKADQLGNDLITKLGTDTVKPQSLDNERNPNLNPELNPELASEGESTSPETLAKLEGGDIGAFPESWASFVERWKKVKPLQARKLEDVIALEYGSHHIKLGVRGDGVAEKALLSPETQARLKREFEEIFGFNGGLSIEPLTIGSSAESLLDIKVREAKERAEKAKIEALESPFVKHVAESFGVSILQVRVTESGQGQ